MAVVSADVGWLGRPVAPIPGTTHPAAASGAPITAEMMVVTTTLGSHPAEVVRVATESVAIDAT